MASPDERLLAAASAGDAEALRAALAEGADVDAVGEDDGRSALHLAAACNSEACCRALLADADCEAEDEDGDTPPALALRAGHTSLFRLLVEEGEVENDATNAGGEGFLHLAAAAGLAEEVAWLLERGASLELKDGARRTPLHAACVAGRWAVALALLEAGADAKAVANGAQTALHFVAANASGRKGRLAVVEALLDKGKCAVRSDVVCDSVLTSLFFRRGCGGAQHHLRAAGGLRDGQLEGGRRGHLPALRVKDISPPPHAARMLVNRYRVLMTAAARCAVRPRAAPRPASSRRR